MMFKKNTDMDFSNKLEGIKQYRQPVMNKENVDFPNYVIQKFQRLKIMTMAVVYEKNPENWYEWLYEN